MSKEAIKMADVFELPVKTNLMTDEHVVVIRGDDAWHLEDDNFWMLSGDHHMEAAAHAINNHDALVQHNAELTEALRDIVEDFAEIANPGKSSLIKARAALSKEQG